MVELDLIGWVLDPELFFFFKNSAEIFKQKVNKSLFYHFTYLWFVFRTFVLFEDPVTSEFSPVDPISHPLSKGN